MDKEYVNNNDHPEFALLLAAGYQWETNMAKENMPYTELHGYGDSSNITWRFVTKYPREVVDNLRRAGYDVGVSPDAFDIYGERLEDMVSVWKRKRE